LESLPGFFTPQDREIIEELYESVAGWWLSLLEGQRVCRELALGLVAIHPLRYTPFSKSFTTRYFTHNPWSSRVLTLITSQLGHSGWLHLTSNVMKLLSVGKLPLTDGISIPEPSQVNSLGIRYGISKQRMENDYTKRFRVITSSHSISSVCSLSSPAMRRITLQQLVQWPR
jgi:hypothetical protein